MTRLAPSGSVQDYVHMGEMSRAYLEVLGLVNLTDVTRETGRGYRTLMAYRDGSRNVTREAAQELVDYLQARSDKLAAAASALAAAVEEEGDG